MALPPHPSRPNAPLRRPWSYSAPRRDAWQSSTPERRTAQSHTLQFSSPWRILSTKILFASSRLCGEGGVPFHHKDAKTQRIAKNCLSFVLTQFCVDNCQANQKSLQFLLVLDFGH